MRINGASGRLIATPVRQELGTAIEACAANRQEA
jgi:hypothetical protein